MNSYLASAPSVAGSSGYSSESGRTGPTPVFVASLDSVYMYGSSRSFSWRYFRLMEVYGSPSSQGCWSCGFLVVRSLAQPSIVMMAGRNAFHWRSRAYIFGSWP